MHLFFPQGALDPRLQILGPKNAKWYKVEINMPRLSAVDNVMMSSQVSIKTSFLSIQN